MTHTLPESSARLRYEKQMMAEILEQADRWKQWKLTTIARLRETPSLTIADYRLFMNALNAARRLHTYHVKQVSRFVAVDQRVREKVLTFLSRWNDDILAVMAGISERYKGDIQREYQGRQEMRQLEHQLQQHQQLEQQQVRRRQQQRPRQQPESLFELTWQPSYMTRGLGPTGTIESEWSPATIGSTALEDCVEMNIAGKAEFLQAIKKYPQWMQRKLRKRRKLYQDTQRRDDESDSKYGKRMAAMARKMREGKHGTGLFSWTSIDKHDEGMEDADEWERENVPEEYQRDSLNAHLYSRECMPPPNAMALSASALSPKAADPHAYSDRIEFDLMLDAEGKAKFLEAIKKMPRWMQRKATKSRAMTMQARRRPGETDDEYGQRMAAVVRKMKEGKHGTGWHSWESIDKHDERMDEILDYEREHVPEKYWSEGLKKDNEQRAYYSLENMEAREQEERRKAHQRNLDDLTRLREYDEMLERTYSQAPLSPRIGVSGHALTASALLRTIGNDLDGSGEGAQILAVTWNTNGAATRRTMLEWMQSPEGDTWRRWLGTAIGRDAVTSPPPPSLVVLALQEWNTSNALPQAFAEWLNQALAERRQGSAGARGGEYVRHSFSLTTALRWVGRDFSQSLHLYLLVTPPHPGGATTESRPEAVANVCFGASRTCTKGAIVVRVPGHTDTPSLYVVAAHFPYGSDHDDDLRNRAYHKTVKAVGRDLESGSRAPVLWLGDLNYRRRPRRGAALGGDRLSAIIRAGVAFAGYREASIAFPPTCKMRPLPVGADRGRREAWIEERDRGGANAYDQKREPSHCDRVLVRGQGMVVRRYDAVPAGATLASDHGAVAAWIDFV